MSLYAYGAASLLALVLLAGTHWKAYVSGKAEVRAEWTAAQLAFQTNTRAKEAAITKQLNEARNAATKRETKLRSDAAGAQLSADKLRDELANISNSLPSLPANSSYERANTLAFVLGECTTAHGILAQQADRITSDRQTLIDAWPN